MHPSVIDFVKTVLTAENVTGKTVLEVGAYDVNGSARPYLESLNPATYLGVDAEPGPSVDRVVNCENLTKEIRTAFDVVVCTEMLEHAKNWQLCVEQMARVTTAGGLLLITTRSPGFLYHPFPDDYWRFTVTEMRQIIRALIFRTVTVENDPGEGCPGVFALAQKPPKWHLPFDYRDACPTIPEGRFDG